MYRCAGSFAMARSTMATTGAGIVGSMAARLGTAASACLSAMLTGLSPS